MFTTAKCPICNSAAERKGRNGSHIFQITCAACGCFWITKTAMACRAVPVSARQNRRLSAVGHTAQIEMAREGPRIVPFRKVRH